MKAKNKIQASGTTRQIATTLFSSSTINMGNSVCHVWAGSSVRHAQHRPALALLTARPTGALPCRYSFIAFRLLVALLGGWDLLLCAKHLFVTAIVAGPGARRHVTVGGGAKKREG